MRLGAKIPRTFWDKYTEQSTRKKVAGGGFEPAIQSAHLAILVPFILRYKNVNDGQTKIQ